MFTPYNLKKRPDQTVASLNKIEDNLAAQRFSQRIVSRDGKSCIVIGNQPNGPDGKPYPFGIIKYKIKGDRLELERTY